MFGFWQWTKERDRERERGEPRVCKSEKLCKVAELLVGIREGWYKSKGERGGLFLRGGLFGAKLSEAPPSLNYRATKQDSEVETR